MPSDLKKLSEAEIAQALKDAPEWGEASGAIQRTYQFADFVAAMKFVDDVARLAEAQQHHPDILIRYNKVTLTVNTHDANGITIKDFALAKSADAAFAGNPRPPRKGA
jgi:4a-hydroxytetrahydrobiopterin dehydratase